MVKVYSTVPNVLTLYAKSSQRFKKKKITPNLYCFHTLMTGYFHSQVPVVDNVFLPYLCQTDWDMPYLHIYLEVVFSFLCAMTVKRV